VSLANHLADLVTRLAPYSETARLDAQVLLAHLLEKSQVWVLAHPETVLTPAQTNKLEGYTARLLQGEPLPYILGHWEFFGLDFEVNQQVLIPRPETELLVENALDWLRIHPGRRFAADIGTGSGCIAVSLAVNISDINLIASDLNKEALETARRNAARHLVSERITFVQTDLLELPINLCTPPVDLIVANLPYIPSPVLHTLPIYGHEPTLALDGGEDGLELIRSLLQHAPVCLSEKGCLLLEIEASQGVTSAALARSAFPSAQVQVLPDLSGLDRLLRIDLSSTF